MSKQSVKPVLLSEAQIQAIRKIQEKQRQQSGIGVGRWIKRCSIWGKSPNTSNARVNQLSAFFSCIY